MSLLSVEVVDDTDSHKYVHSLLDFLLFPEKFDAHLQGLRQGTLHFPSGTELIRHCLQQASAAQARDPQLAPAAPTPPVTMEAPQGPWQGPLSPTPLAAPVAKRAKMLHSWAAKIGHVLELPLDVIEKELPINMQQPLITQMCQHYPNDKTNELDYYRWVLRALMRNVALNFITPSLPHSTDSKSNKETIADENASKELEREGKKVSGDASMPARTFLKTWVNQHRDYSFDSSPASTIQVDQKKFEKYLVMVPFELGEFHFFIEDFAEAEKLFLLAKDRASSFAAKYHLDPNQWPVSRERVEGFLHACMIIGYRIYAKDSPLRAAQGLTGIIEDPKWQHSSTRMLRLEELRLLIISIPFLPLSDQDKRLRKEELSWRMWELLMEDNFRDDINWSYRLYLTHCSELAFMHGQLCSLNDLKLVLREFNFNEKTVVSTFTSSVHFLSRLVNSGSTDEITTLPLVLRGLEELLPQLPDQPPADAVHMPPHIVRFLFAVSVDAIKRFSELGPLCFGTGTNTPAPNTSQALAQDFFSEKKIKSRITRSLFRVAQREDTTECWLAMHKIAKLFGLEETRNMGSGPSALHNTPSLSDIGTALHLAQARAQMQQQIDNFAHLQSDERLPANGGQDQTLGEFFLNLQPLIRMAGTGDWTPPREKQSPSKDLRLSFLIKRAKHFFHIGDLENSNSFLDQAEAIFAHVKEKDTRKEEYAWSFRQEVVYGRLVVEIKRWENKQRATKQNTTEQSRHEHPSGAISTMGFVDSDANSIMQRLFQTLTTVGPPKEIEHLVIVLGFLINSRQWLASGKDSGQPIQQQGDSPLHKYCHKVESLSAALLQKQHRSEIVPAIITTAWNVPHRYIESVQVALLLADLCVLVTRYILTSPVVEKSSDNRSDARATSRPEATDKMELETKDGEMEEGETRGDTSVAATMSTQITSLFDGLLDFLAVSSQGSMGSSKLIIPCVEWTGSQGLLKQLWDPTCLESMVGLLAGSLYHIQRQAHVPSMLAIENYGHLAQLASSDRFFERSARVSPQTVASLWEVFRATLKRLNKTQPQNECWLFGLGDAAYEVSQFHDAARYYLLGGGINNSFFCDPASTISAGFTRIVPRLVTSLISIRAYLEAAVLCQFPPVPDYATAFKAVQVNPAALHEPFFHYLWEMPILELLVNIYTKMGQTRRAAFLIDLIGQKDLNEFNGAALRSSFVDSMKLSFLKMLCHQLLTPPVPPSRSFELKSTN